MLRSPAGSVENETTSQPVVRSEGAGLTNPAASGSGQESNAKLLSTSVAHAARPAAPEGLAPTSHSDKAARSASSDGPSWPTRRALAFGLMGLLGVLVVAAVVAMFTDVGLSRVKDVMAIVFGPVAGLAGSAVGFYFGAKTGSESPQPPKSPQASTVV